MTAAWCVFAALWLLMFLLVGLCSVDWNDRGGL